MQKPACDRLFALTHAPYTNKGVALRNLKRHAEALAAFDQAIRLDPNYARTYSNKGNALTDLKRHAEALAAFERTNELSCTRALHYDLSGEKPRTRLFALTPTTLVPTITRAVHYITSSGMQKPWRLMSRLFALIPTSLLPIITRAVHYITSSGMQKP